MTLLEVLHSDYVLYRVELYMTVSKFQWNTDFAHPMRMCGENHRHGGVMSKSQGPLVILIMSEQGSTFKLSLWFLAVILSCLRNMGPGQWSFSGSEGEAASQPVGQAPVLQQTVLHPWGGPLGPTTSLANPGLGSAQQQCPWLQRLW